MEAFRAHTASRSELTRIRKAACPGATETVEFQVSLFTKFARRVQGVVCEWVVWVVTVPGVPGIGIGAAGAEDDDVSSVVVVELCCGGLLHPARTAIKLIAVRLISARKRDVLCFMICSLFNW